MFFAHTADGAYIQAFATHKSPAGMRPVIFALLIRAYSRTIYTMAAASYAYSAGFVKSAIRTGDTPLKVAAI